MDEQTTLWVTSVAIVASSNADNKTEREGLLVI